MDEVPENKSSPGQDKPKLTVVRWIFAVVGALIMVFCGGCSLLILGDLASRGRWSDNYVSVEIVLLIGGVPFLVGLLIWWLAVKVGRG
ncbi:MAG: hypothetical protein GY948_21785 [Alphaproteobacteria bacterium]|nr:hypothetical protein [Alphaproteobacteria bacterium]